MCGKPVHKGGGKDKCQHDKCAFAAWVGVGVAAARGGNGNAFGMAARVFWGGFFAWCGGLFFVAHDDFLYYLLAAKWFCSCPVYGALRLAECFLGMPVQRCTGVFLW